MRAMNSARPGDMGLQTHLKLTLLTIRLAHLHTLTHRLTMSLLAPVRLAPTHDSPTNLHVLVAVIDILWLMRWSNG